MPPGKFSLGREAQKDYVKTYRHVGDPKRARFVFAELIADEGCLHKDCMSMVEMRLLNW